MQGKAWLIFLMILGLARALSAGLVTLNDGTSLSGELKEQDNGDVIVVTGAGEVKVTKDKIRSIVNDASTNAAQGDMSYVSKVKARREKYGNEDGLPRTQMINQTQVSFSLGYLSNFGDALGTDASNFNGPYFGLSIANSFNDLVGWELWGGYGFGQHDYGSAGSSQNVFVGRWDIAFEPRLQKAISLGAVEQQIMFIPHFGIGPIYSNMTYSSVNSSAIGGVFSVGADFQFGPALVGLKYRYIMSYLTNDSFINRDASAGLIQVNVGWAF